MFFIANAPVTLVGDCVMRARLRSGLRTGEQAKVVQNLEAAGCTVDISMLDVADPAQAAQLLADAAQRAPVGGIFHLAMVMEDRLIVKQARHASSATCILRWLLRLRAVRRGRWRL